MFTVDLEPYDMHVWEGQIDISTLENTALLLTKHYKTSIEKCAEKMLAIFAHRAKNVKLGYFKPFRFSL